jgi:hypothetical protein
MEWQRRKILKTVRRIAFIVQVFKADSRNLPSLN